MLSICLWKEWREHRATFAWLLGIALSVQLLLTMLLPGFWVGGTFVRCSMLAWAAIAVLMFSTALVQTEFRTEHDAFPLRLPAGEGLRFYSKVVLLGLLVTGVLLSLGAIQALALWLRGVPSMTGLSESLRLVPVLLSAGLLLMAVAWWLPRSALVHPFALLLLGIVTLPFTVSFVQRSWVVPSSTDSLLLFGLLLPLLSLVVARLSSLGIKVSAQRAFCMGGGAFVCSLLGLSVVGAVRMDAWDRFDPLAEDAHIDSALIGEGGKLAYINASRIGVPRGYALIVDLETGAWDQVGDMRSQFFSCAYHDRSTPYAWSSAGRHAVVLESRSDGRLTYRNGSDAGILGSGFRRLAYGPVFQRLRESLAGVAFLRTKDGERAWFLEGPEVGSPSAPRALPWTAGDVPWAPVGCAGLRVSNTESGEQRYFDLDREAIFVHPDASSRAPGQKPRSAMRRVWAITPAGWILADADWQEPTQSRTLYLHEPRTGEERKLCELPPLTSIVGRATFPDGRIVLLQPGQGRLEKHIVIYDPVTGERASPSLDRKILGRCTGSGYNADRSPNPVWTGAGECMFSVQLNTSRGLVNHLVALSPDTMELRVIALPDSHWYQVLDASDASTVTILDAQAGEIRRYRWGQDEGEVLWPRAVSPRVPGRFQR